MIVPAIRRVQGGSQVVAQSRRHFSMARPVCGLAMALIILGESARAFYAPASCDDAAT
jgi:hypothetical protein